MAGFRAAVDIGGTFTDVVFLGDDGRVLVKKVASTPDDYGRGVLAGLDECIRTLGIEPGNVTEIGHGFTVATNAILEGKGEKTALVTTAGFRDVLELGRIRTPRLYDLYYRKPPPLVERRLRFEVRERVSYEGEVLQPLDLSDVEAVADRLAEEGVRSVAVSLLHSYANPDHEARIAELLMERLPGLDLSLSSQVLPEMREYERTSTTVINAYVRPVVARYLNDLDRRLRARGLTIPLTIMQSNGGLAPVDVTVDRPIFCIESGPAAGVVGAYHLGRRIDAPDIISFDMGGTTAKASIIEGGEMLRAPEYEVGGGMSVGHRLLTGGGYVLRVPAIDLAEVSAGGGSIAWVDKAGALQCGPQSAGAAPGPVCYANGGQEPTVTDANVALGYLNPDYLLGGAFPIDADAARRAIADRVAVTLNLSGTDAAHGIHLLVNSNMGRALRAVSSERGRDPRRFTMVAFGGGGPLHAAGLAEMLGIGRVVVPPSPGAFSAFGLLFADVEHHFVQTHFRRFSSLDLDEANAILRGLKEQGAALLSEEGFDPSRQQTETQVDMKYVGQTSELTVRMDDDSFSPDSLDRLAEAYAAEHEKTYGYRVDEPMQLVSVRVVARGLSDGDRVPGRIAVSRRHADHGNGQRLLYFGPRTGWVDTPVIDRLDLDDASSDGPLVVEEYDSTVVVPPRWRASLDSLKNIVLTGGGR